MLIVLVDVQVVPDGVSQFVEATEANAQASRQEAGISRFDVIQRQDNTVVQALVLIYAAISILGLLIGDILMAVVDPRISLSKKEGAR